MSTSEFEYRVDSKNRRMAFGGAVLFALFMTAPITILANRAFTGFSFLSAMMIIILVVVVIYNVYLTINWSRNAALKVSSNGLEYYSPGIVISTSWENIKSISTNNWNEEIILKKPSARSIGWWTSFLRATTTASRNVDRRIPLHIFGLSSKYGTFHEHIHNFAPWLLNA